MSAQLETVSFEELNHGADLFEALTAHVQSDPAASERAAVSAEAMTRARGSLLTNIKAFLNSMGVGPAKIESLLPQIIGIIAAAATGGSVNWLAILPQVLALLETPAA
jgi:hypothetical protein